MAQETERVPVLLVDRQSNHERRRRQMRRRVVAESRHHLQRTAQRTRVRRTAAAERDNAHVGERRGSAESMSSGHLAELAVERAEW